MSVKSGAINATRAGIRAIGARLAQNIAVAIDIAAVALADELGLPENETDPAPAPRRRRVASRPPARSTIVLTEIDRARARMLREQMGLPAVKGQTR